MTNKLRCAGVRISSPLIKQNAVLTYFLPNVFVFALVICKRSGGPKIEKLLACCILSAIDYSITYS